MTKKRAFGHIHLKNHTIPYCEHESRNGKLEPVMGELYLTLSEMTELTFALEKKEAELKGLRRIYSWGVMTDGSGNILRWDRATRITSGNRC